MVICASVTKNGTSCKREAERGSRYCWQHGDTTVPSQGSFLDLLSWTAVNLGQENADRLESYFSGFHPDKREVFVAKALSKPDKSRLEFVRRFVENKAENEIEDTFEALAPRISFNDALAALRKKDSVMTLILYKAFLLHFNQLTREERFAFYSDKLGLDLQTLKDLSYRDREDVIYEAFKSWIFSLSAFRAEVFVRALFDEDDMLIRTPLLDFYALLP